MHNFFRPEPLLELLYLQPFVFEHFQKVEIVLKPTGCTGFRNSIAGPEHTLCLVDTQGYLHLFDRHTIYGLEYSI